MERRNTELVVDIVYNKFLILLEDIVTSMSGKSLLHFGLPEAIREQSIVINRHYMRELVYDVSQLMQVVSVCVSKFNYDQKKAYDDVLTSVESNSRAESSEEYPRDFDYDKDSDNKFVPPIDAQNISDSDDDDKERIVQIAACH
ncbi:hypothetical protein NPIL_487141 [Nephila pilipes]|uniref:Uncharacterized protein n=1 Tax=Nephila pilipes TaxID=299642 RepID=A0A8X6UMU9_NEPPI|nr:hypothetical protein NPIL_487141 [Nephila pilipes]